MAEGVDGETAKNGGPTACASGERTPAEDTTSSNGDCCCEAPTGEDGKLPRTTSALRSSIARYGSNSYYYAHAPLPGAPHNGEVKVVTGPGVVTGGSPQLLERRQAVAAAKSSLAILSAQEAAAAAGAGNALSEYKPIQNYMWTDEGSTVRVYVQLEKLPEAGAREVQFEKDKVGSFFCGDRLVLAVHGKANNYLLVLNRLYHPVDPSKCRVSVRDDRISAVLTKEDPELTWFSLTRSR